MNPVVISAIGVGVAVVFTVIAMPMMARSLSSHSQSVALAARLSG